MLPWHSHATRLVYREFLIRRIKPCWGSFNIRDVRTVAVESWLRQLRRRNGDDLANSTKAKIRNVMSVLFDHAIRYEWLDPRTEPDHVCATDCTAKMHSIGVGAVRDPKSVIRA
jgi:hypothetical protein